MGGKEKGNKYMASKCTNTFNCRCHKKNCTQIKLSLAKLLNLRIKSIDSINIFKKENIIGTQLRCDFSRQPHTQT